MASKVVPFSNGSEYQSFMSMNCDCCTKQYDPDLDVGGEPPCLLEEELSLASIGDGTITAETAAKLGIGTNHRYVEFVPLGSPVDSPRRPLPGQMSLFGDGSGANCP